MIRGFPEALRFNSQQLHLHGVSQSSIMGFDAIFCHAGIYTHRVFVYIKYTNK